MKKLFGIAVLLAIVGIAVAQTATPPAASGPQWQSAELAQLRGETIAAQQKLAQLNADANADPSALETQAQLVDKLRAQYAEKATAERDAWLSNGGVCPNGNTPGSCGMGQCGMGNGQCQMGSGQCGMGMGQCGMGNGQCQMGMGQGRGMGRGMGAGMGRGMGAGQGRGMRAGMGRGMGRGQGNGGVCPNQPAN